MRSARVCRGLQLGWEPGRTCSGSTTRLEFDPRHAPTPQDWLSLTGQVALEVVGGEVFEDTGGALTALRAAMDWYPDDLWRYLVACDWRRIDQELPLMGRAADRGDDLGSRVFAARLVDRLYPLHWERRAGDVGRDQPRRFAGSADPDLRGLLAGTVVTSALMVARALRQRAA